MCLQGIRKTDCVFQVGLQRAFRPCERELEAVSTLSALGSGFPREAGQSESWAVLCTAHLLRFPPGEGNLPLAGQRVPENHVGCGLDCGADQGGRSPRAAAGKREASQHVPGQPGMTAAGAGPGKAVEALVECSLGFQRQGPPAGSPGASSGIWLGPPMSECWLRMRKTMASPVTLPLLS